MSPESLLTIPFRWVAFGEGVLAIVAALSLWLFLLSRRTRCQTSHNQGLTRGLSRGILLVGRQGTVPRPGGQGPNPPGGGAGTPGRSG